MLRTPGKRFSRSMQGIPEEDETRQIVDTLCRQMRRDPATERFTSDHQTVCCKVGLLSNCADSCLVGIDQALLTIRSFTSLRHIKKIEGEDVNAARCQPDCERRHETTGLTGSRTVPENQEAWWFGCEFSSIGKTGDLVVAN